MGGAVKVAVIGAGSTYTPELVEGFIKREGILPLAELRLMDIDPGKLGIVGGLAGRMLEAAGSRARLSLGTDLDDALRDADFIVCQIRVGGLEARALDERIPLRHGFIGQETTGLGGLANALRSIPVVAGIAQRTTELAPGAWFVNFANPSGLVAEALVNGLGLERVVGLCNVPINLRADIAALAPPGAKVEFEYVGLNHFSWVTKVWFDGREVLAEALRSGASFGAMRNVPGSDFEPGLLAALGAIPNIYLQYYYHRERQLEHLRAAPMTRAEECMAIERGLLSSYADPSLKEKPAALEKRGGHLYSEAAVSLIEAIANDTGAVHVVNTRNAGALGFLGPRDVAEIACRVGRAGPVPIPVNGFDNPHIEGMVRMMKAYERCAARAALEGDRGAALEAFLLHPLVGDYDRGAAALDELLAAEAAWLPRFAQRDIPGSPADAHPRGDAR